MQRTFEDLSYTLNQKNIRPTFQRIKILEYLCKNQHHPTVDTIFLDLQREIPMLSKTTIYSTLNVFAESGLICTLNIEDNETRYDIITKSHGHFKCEKCKNIYNFSINIDDFKTEELDNFLIKSKGIYFKGICPKCL